MSKRRSRLTFGTLVGAMLGASSAHAAPVRDGAFSVDLGPEVCFVEPASLRDPAACAGFTDDEIPFGKPGTANQPVALGVFALGTGAGRKIGAVTIVREPVQTEPSVAVAEGQFADTATQLQSVLGLSHPLKVADVGAQTANGLAVVRGEILLDDPARADSLMARKASLLVYTDEGLYGITFSTPLAGTELANVLRERALVSVHGNPTHPSMAGELKNVIRKNAFWLVPLILVPLILEAWKRRRARSRRQ